MSTNQKTRKLDNYCNVCGKGFINNEKHAQHILNFHVTCSEENCNYSAPKEIMHFHKLKHITNNEGNSITESIEEIEKWLICRKMKFPKSVCLKNHSIKSQGSNEILQDNDKKKCQSTQISALEHYIRINMNNQIPFSHSEKLNKFLNKNNINYNSNFKLRKNNMYGKALQENKKIQKSLLFKLFRSEIHIYEKKMISAINHIIERFHCKNLLN
ncbi:hypothetical protein CmeUKMEL1_11795 [Cryptosporidium meleagridis]|uniref:C2H2-type domain-containing protein n=1 Tax=Cryptosporidium meleagridis TaxID=93969 RepID=A0A2P4Z2L2_9CRYT|nr:hypothetical protein CmeUKMEL1_11795 [Cryptosporidium meleagridis]